MRNVFCDICGTAYPESERNCPTCGSPQGFTLEGLEEEFVTDGLYDDVPQPPRSRRSREIFDYDEVNPEPRHHLQEEPDFYDEEDAEQPQHGSNAILVVVLLILIVLLLAAAGYMYLRFFLPNVKEEPVETAPVVSTMAAEETAPTETTEDPGIPCSDIVMEGGKIELGEAGKWLLNVKVYPADTTDTLIYASADETIAVVSDSGTITAVGEGETEIIISCGQKQIRCAVLVDHSLTAETTEEETLPTLEVESETEEETQPEDVAEATEPAAEETEAEEEEDADSGDGKLALKQSDITIFSNHTSIRLELEGGIAPEDVKWYTVDSSVAICHDGVVTSTGSGITRIIGEYKGQSVECIVRCSF